MDEIDNKPEQTPQPGDSLGPYELISLLGAGGMGKVYRARDRRLGREVALKLLPQEMMDNPRRLQRFATEARSAGALNHPNIVAVFDVNLEPPNLYIVTELVDGHSLRRLMERGPVPVKKLYDLAVQIADGLTAAHGIGITHRDLKPENILLTRDDRPKIADFGLAKQEAPAADPEGSTMTMNLTVDGKVVGTAGYMSPEQIKGLPVDHRSDIFSFGLVLYEMASGRRPFQGSSVMDLLAATLKDNPAPLEVDIPQPLQWTIERCLSKEPAERYADTRDLFQDLRHQRERALEMSGMWMTPAMTGKRRRFSWRTALATTSAMLVVTLGAALFLEEPTADISKYQLTPLATSDEFEDAVAWSPDGASIVYQGTVSSRPQIFLKVPASPTPVQLTRCSEPCTSPSWSGDGTRVYFLMRGGLWSVGVAGGDPVLVHDQVREYAVSRDGGRLAILRSLSGGNQILLSEPPGAALAPYPDAPLADVAFSNRPRLAFSPDGSRLGIMAWVSQADRGMEFWELPVPAGKPRKALASIARKFPIRGFDWMPDGRHIVLAAPPKGEVFNTNLHMADIRRDRVWPLVAGIGVEGMPSVSPDGSRLGYTAMEWDNDLVEIDTATGNLTRLLATRRSEYAPDWSPKGDMYAYVTNRSGRIEIWAQSMQRGWDRPLATSENFSDGEDKFLSGPVFSPDGERVAFVRHGVGLGENALPRIWVASVTAGAPVPLRITKGSQWIPSWSPNGEWVVFHHTAEKSGLVKVRVGGLEPPVMLMEAKHQLVPAWSPKGGWIAAPLAGGLTLISEDGKQTRLLDERRFEATGWSRDGSLLYALLDMEGSQRLLSFDAATGRKRGEVAIEIAIPNTRVGSRVSPTLRLSSSPDGKRLATSTLTTTGDLWMLKDFHTGNSLLQRLWLAIGR
ncbi:MAG: hypothetical protein FJW20_07265 [Acidimicrobiia bacterium]|nr:hypothetical protein [Acidimicrobiia bacterium]